MPVGIKTSDFQTAANLISESGLNSLQGRIAEVIAAERERCAKIAEHSAAIHSNPDLSIIGRNIAAEIRNPKSEDAALA